MKWLKWPGIALLLSPMVVLAQAYPNKPVLVVVASPPGGSIDVTARIVFDGLTAQLKQFPDIPTIGETVPGFEFTAWVGCFVPAGTPRIIVDKLNREFRKLLADPGVAAKLNGLTLEPMYMTPDEFALRLKSDYEKYGKIIKLAGAKVN